MAGVVPIQSADRGFPLHVPVDDAGVKGFACVEMVRNVDVEHRGFRILGAASPATMVRIMSLLKGMYGFQ